MKKLLILLIILSICLLAIAGCVTSATTTSTNTATVTAAQAGTPASTTTASQAASQGAATTPTSNKYGGIIRGVELSSGGINVGLIFQLGGAPKTYTIETLLSEKADGSLIPFLASSCDIVTDPDNPSVTFHLQKGVKFSHRTDFNAQAVRWNFDIMATAKVFPIVTRYWKSVDVLGDYTI